MSPDSHHTAPPPAIAKEVQSPPEEHVAGPAPIGTLIVIAILLLVTIAFWMLVLGIQQARA